MRYETAQALKDKYFKRSTGAQRNTFEKLLEVVTNGLRDFGRPTSGKPIAVDLDALARISK